MSKKYTILALFAGVTLLLSFSDNPPNARTGAPGEGTCADCHSLGGASQDGSITVTGLPASISPNTAYILTVTDNNPNGLAELAGFQLTILNSNNTIAGLITAPSAGSSTIMSGGRQYWEHNPAQMFPGSNIVTWTAIWTSPNMPPNTTITFYAKGNIAGGNGNPSMDLIVTDTGSGMLMGGGSNLAVTITSSTDALCFDSNTGSATATASGGTTPYVYNWSNGATGATANNLGAGTYTVTVTDNAAATASTSVTITEPPPLLLNSPNITNVSCNGGNSGSINVTATGGIAPYIYNWSNGSSGTTISNLTAGSYTVTVTDDNSCTKTATYIVTQPAMINISLVNLDHESCSGADDGSITIGVSGGVNPIFAEWSNGSIGLTISNLSPDIYSVTVTDNNDCTKMATYTVNAGGTVDVNLVQIQHVSCFGGSNGAVSVSASGGLPPYTFAWSNGMTGASITGLIAGNYLVTATDMNGCFVVENYTINQPTAINITINQTSPNLCFGDATADLTALVTGGSSPYTSMWSNGIVGLNNNNLVAGTYTITVTDQNNCTKTASAVVAQPAALSLSVATTNETSAGANNGTATANVSGGSVPVSFLWNTNATTQTITNLPPGMYCVTITDINGCSTNGCGQVNEFGCSLNVLLGSNLTICEGDTLTITPAISGASGTVSFVWSDGSTGNSLQITTPGEYCVTATDMANCQDSDCITIEQLPIPQLICPVTNESAPGANDGAINCGDPGSLSFLWSNGATTPAITGLAPGEYCVTLTNNMMCTLVQCFNVQPGNCQLIVTSTVTDLSCNGDSTGSVDLIVTGGTAPISFEWSTGDSTATINNLPAGNFTVTVNDAAGCIENQTFVITQPDILEIMVDTIIHIFPDTAGSIYISITGGTEPYTILWTLPSGGMITGVEDLLGLDEFGSYTLSITDSSGCSVTENDIIVDIIDALEPTPKFRTLKVYPVPTEDVLIVEMEKSVIEVLITGIDGRLYKRIANPESNKLQVGELEAGWYILRITDGENWYIARFVK